MIDEVILENSAARVGILPRRGAAMSRYEYLTGGQVRPLLTGPDGRVNLVMAPWQNRISNGGFSFEGRVVALEANSPLDPLPLHGNAWLLPWEIATQDSGRLLLRLASDGPGPYRYRAQAMFHLDSEGRLETTLAVTNCGPALPFGLGFHPNFTRTAQVLLKAPAHTLTLQDEHHLPTATLGSASRPELDFTRASAIPDGPINNEFGGWTSEAEITWPEWGITCRLTAPGVTRYLLHTPGTESSFFSLEPVTHSIDAFNRPDPFANGGLVVLQPGERLSLTTIFQPSRISRGS